MPLTRLLRSLKRGELRFEKFGEIDYAALALIQENTLFIDIDSKTAVTTVPDVYSLCRVIGLHPVNLCYKRTRRGWHLILIVRERMTELERICLQSIFGDDEWRAALNFMRYWHSKGQKVPKFWRERSNILYRRKLI